MKTVVIGDIHGRSVWKLIVHQERDASRFIFIGDYFDSFDISGIEQIHNFKEIIEFKETSGKEVILLIGNHDYHYYPETTSIAGSTSGFQIRLANSIRFAIDENRDHLQIAYQEGSTLFTHAGVSSEYMDQVFGIGGWKVENIVNDLNELFKYKPLAFDFYGRDSYGDDTYQTPIWIRPRSLMKVNRKTLRKELIQVVGHTEQNEIDIKGKSTGGRYYFIDTLGTSGEYLIIENEKFKVNSVK